jgi:hypothetical protein
VPELSGRPGVIGRAGRAATQPKPHDAPDGGNTTMTISALTLTPLISLIAGVLILVMPRLLNYIVALYLIVVGLLGLFPNLAH